MHIKVYIYRCMYSPPPQDPPLPPSLSFSILFREEEKIRIFQEELKTRFCFPAHCCSSYDACYLMNLSAAACCTFKGMDP